MSRQFTPPVTQLGFRLLAWIQPSVLLFKLGFVAADLAVCGLLVRWFGASQAAVYAWNPLVLYSFAGGGHYDSWFVLPVVMAWGLADRGRGSSTRSRNHGAARWLGASLCLGFSIAVKWVSLPLLGFVSWSMARAPRWVCSADIYRRIAPDGDLRPAVLC